MTYLIAEIYSSKKIVNSVASTVVLSTFLSFFRKNSGITPNEIIDIYKKYKVSQMLKMSSSLKFCVLAAGEADIYAANARAYEWDIAAGHAILEHAGGFMTTHEEKKFFYGKDNYKNLPIIAKRAMSLEK